MTTLSVLGLAAISGGVLGFRRLENSLWLNTGDFEHASQPFALLIVLGALFLAFDLLTTFLPVLVRCLDGG